MKKLRKVSKCVSSSNVSVCLVYLTRRCSCVVALNLFIFYSNSSGKEITITGRTSVVFSCTHVLSVQSDFILFGFETAVVLVLPPSSFPGKLFHSQMVVKVSRDRFVKRDFPKSFAPQLFTFLFSDSRPLL